MKTEIIPFKKLALFFLLAIAISCGKDDLEAVIEPPSTPIATNPCE